MADYNIYIRTIGGEGGEGSAVKPFQTGGGDAAKEASQFISKAGAFMENPDSIVGAATNVGVGTLSKLIPGIGVAIIAVGIAAKVSDSIITRYHSINDPISGDYNFSIGYGNFKQQLSNVFRPFSTYMESLKHRNEMLIQNARDKQLFTQLGGTIYNSKYGRYI